MIWHGHLEVQENGTAAVGPVCTTTLLFISFPDPTSLVWDGCDIQHSIIRISTDIDSRHDAGE